MTSAGEPEVHARPSSGPPGWRWQRRRRCASSRARPMCSAEAREELLALKSGAVFVCARRDGDIRPARASGEGLYVEDTRHLSELRLTVGGLPPVLLSSVMESGHHAVINATNPVLRSAGGVPVPQETLNVRRTVLIADRLFYRVRVRNFRPEPVATTVEVSLAADFADVFEVRGVDRRTSGRVLAPVRDGDRVRFGYVAADGERRETLVELEPSPARVRIDGGRVHVAWDVELDAREAISLLDHGDARRRRRRRAPSRQPREAAAALESRPRGLGWRVRAGHDRQRAVRPPDRRLRARSARADDAGRGERAAGGRDPVVRRAVRSRLAADRVRGADDQPRGGARHAAGARRAAGAGRRGLARRRAGQDPARAAHRRARPHRAHPAHALLRHRRRDAAVPDGRRRLLPLDARPRHDGAAAPGARRRAATGSTSGAIATATGSSSTSAARPAGLVNQGWKDSHDCDRARRRVARARARSRSSRSRATCTRRSCGSPTSTRRSGTRRAPTGCGREAGEPAGGVQRGVLGSRGGVLRARARRAQGARSAASRRTRRTACTAGSSTTTRPRSSPSG